MPDGTPPPEEPRPDLSERLRTVYKTECRRCGHFNSDMSEPHAVMAEAADALDAGAQRVAVLESLLVAVTDYADEAHDDNARHGADEDCNVCALLAEAREAVPPEANKRPSWAEAWAELGDISAAPPTEERTDG